MTTTYGLKPGKCAVVELDSGRKTIWVTVDGKLHVAESSLQQRQ